MSSYFNEWMINNGLTSSSAKKYEIAITGVITDWAIENSIISGPLVDITNLSEFKFKAELIQKIPIFIKRNSVGKHMYSSALKKYAEYLESSPSNSIENDIKSIIESPELEITEKESLIKTRIGQGNFRGALINYWKKCSVTGFKDVNLLVASHIKPWAASNNKERTDLYNGLLLLPNLDRAFDLGYISFNDDGKIIISRKFENPERLGIQGEMTFHIELGHKKYLEFHRRKIFQK